METLKTPNIDTVHQGQFLKVLRVIGEAGMYMPAHYSTREAVLVCKSGSATLNMEGMNHPITPGVSLIIPAGAIHSLTPNIGFQAFVIMDIKSAIIFENN